MSTLKLSPSDLKHVEAYAEYRNIVGDTDDGQLLSQNDYERLRRRAAATQKDPLLVFWRNEANLDCKIIGPLSLCLCGHRYRDHDWLVKSPSKHVQCRMRSCPCLLFSYIPVHGSQDIKCRCKHSFRDHHPLTQNCSKCRDLVIKQNSGSAASQGAVTAGRPNIRRAVTAARGGIDRRHTVTAHACTSFSPPYTCCCGSVFAAHRTVFERVAERGEKVPNIAVATLGPTGGLTGERLLLIATGASAAPIVPRVGVGVLYQHGQFAASAVAVKDATLLLIMLAGPIITADAAAALELVQTYRYCTQRVTLRNSARTRSSFVLCPLQR